MFKRFKELEEDVKLVKDSISTTKRTNALFGTYKKVNYRVAEDIQRIEEKIDSLAENLGLYWNDEKVKRKGWVKIQKHKERKY